eukprot:1649284-Amphidinium_carterae.3
MTKRRDAQLHALNHKLMRLIARTANAYAEPPDKFRNLDTTKQRPIDTLNTDTEIINGLNPNRDQPTLGNIQRESKHIAKDQREEPQ